ncbi:N-6 DNA methylase [Prevotella denticola]|uniref:Eco57I restriction-modification methylase domain-containing protein n=2 Tax=Prevotella denticola TaxID=28129 RepID=UPI001BAC4C54|nr:TaqI-like C-terminal specificity domain-containing protein [Prevotella denticola]QUB94076.1 N-6 DNA methylase [Prevotella denticola]
MNKNILQTYLSDRYQGSRSFLENIIFPIFGEDSFEDGHETEFLNQKDEYRKTSETLGIRSVRQVGKIEVGVEPLYIFDVTVSDRVRMERNRVGIQRLVRSIMGTYSCAFMLFHYENDVRWDWRFTFCHISGDRKTATDSKRYTFLLGPEQSCHTAGQNFMKLYEKHGPIEVKDIEDAFNVEALSNEFFGKYKSEYDSFVEYITGKRYVKKGGKYVEAQTHAPHPTLYPAFGSNDKLVRDYVKKLLGRIVFLHFLQKKGWLGVPAGKDWGDGDRSFMLHLFENASEEQKDNFLDEVLEGVFADGLDCDRSDRNDLYDTKVEGFRNCRIPYLNGGLFERDPLDEKTVKFPAEYFDSLLTMLSQYNFTIDENDPDDAEVGIDPEMLGRIFENLLEDNKDKGAFYTPKEIVQYMCRESLIAYLQTGQTEEDRERLRRFVTTHDGEQLDGLKGVLDQKLRDVKICDPAIGSGAFPMGLLRELFLCRAAIEPDVAENAADIKRHIIQNNIYGVDIERGAVDIARLRFWLSLIVDEKSPEALPNLDFKIMQGNSLLEQYKGIDLSAVTGRKEETEKTVTFFGNLVDDSRRQLCEKLDEYYACPEHTQKVELRKQIAEIVKQELVEQGITVDFGDIDLAANSQFFLWHTWFHDVFSRPSKEGFDIVIGNPPYGASLTNTEKKIYRLLYPETQFKIDTYSLFLLLSIRLLKENGYSYMIIPNTLLDNYFEEEVRKVLLRNKIYEINDLSDKVFDTAIVHSMIFAFCRRPSENCKIRVSTSSKLDDINITIPSSYFSIQPQHSFSIRSYGNDDLIRKLRAGSVRLFDVLDIRQAIKSGNDKQYITDAVGIDGNYQPILRGKDINRFSITDPHLYLQYGKHLACPRNKEIFEQPKILIREAGSVITATYDDNNFYIMSSLYNAILRDKAFSLKYLLGLLNSRLFQFLMYKLTFEKTRGAFTKAKIFHYYELPVKDCSPVSQQEIIGTVDEILAEKKKNPMVNVGNLEFILNKLVYDLYGLTDDEIRIVEECVP